MSSILKALKKIETESVDNVDIRPLPLARQTATSARHRGKDNRFFYKAIIFLPLLVILAGSAWFIFDRSSREAPLPPAAVTDEQAASPVTSQKEKAGRQISGKPETKAETKPPKPTAAPEKKRAMSAAFHEDGITAQAAKQPEQTAIKTAANASPKSVPVKKPSPEPAKEELKTNTPAAISEESTPAPASGQNSAFSRSYIGGNERTEPSDPFAAIPEKSEEDSGLKLQAIAWSEDPQNRMTVINNSIVREGGSVEGSTVTHIGEDMVVFKKEGEVWKQLFRLR